MSNAICNVWISSSCRSQRDENGNGDGEAAAGSSSAKTAEKKMSARTENSIISDEEFQRYGLYEFSVTPLRVKQTHSLKGLPIFGRCLYIGSDHKQSAVHVTYKIW